VEGGTVMVRKEGATLIGVGMVRELGGWIEGEGDG
jgi:hypothetical protein